MSVEDENFEQPSDELENEAPEEEDFSDPGDEQEEE
jgi:hypothetical protein